MSQELGTDPPSKNGVAVELGPQDANATMVYEKRGNQHDELDMDRMGKLQELRVSPHTVETTSIRANPNHMYSETLNSCPFLAMQLFLGVPGSTL